MSPPMPEAPTAPAIVLPRPNPGPEPWAPSSVGVPPAVVLIAALALMALAGALLWRLQRRRAGRGRPAGSSGGALVPEPVASGPLDLLATAAEARRRLATVLGPVWLARTTEETAASPELRARLGEADHRRLADLLVAADRAKFAGTAPSAEPPEGASALLERLGALSAGEPSTNGAAREDSAHPPAATFV
jgi:hypothetical protein